MQAVIDLIERVAGIACGRVGRDEPCDCHVCEARRLKDAIEGGQICLSETCEAPDLISVSATLAHGEDSVTASVTAPADSDVHKLFDEVWRQVANNETT